MEKYGYRKIQWRSYDGEGHGEGQCNISDLGDIIFRQEALTALT